MMADITAKPFSNFVKHIFVLVVFLLRTSAQYPKQAGAPSDKTFSFPTDVFLDGEENFRFLWTTNETDLVFRLEVKTMGYVGFGFSPKGDMKNADIMIAWISQGVANIWDYYSYTEGRPKMDSYQDWKLMYGYENGTHTVLGVTRALNTCDEKDHVITEGTIHVIWAYHPQDPRSAIDFFHHGYASRGSRSLHLLGKSPTRAELPPDTLSWELRNDNITVPVRDDTYYWCELFKLPEFGGKRHIIRWEPIIKSGNEHYVHHILVYACTARNVPSHLLDQGRQCYFNMPEIFWQCNEPVFGWALGSGPFMLPDEVGISVGGENDPRYVMMETHYDNPGFHKNVIDNSGIRVYYTANLRANDGGILLVGMNMNWTTMIPPYQDTFTTYGHCGGECTKQTLPKDGIMVVGGFVHTHTLGRQLVARHFRRGRELREIMRDDQYDSKYQEAILYRKPVKLKPGDHIVLECTYDSRTRTEPTYGGFSTRNELCVNYFIYYPRIPLTTCMSNPTESAIFTGVGIEEFWPNSNWVKKPPSNNLTYWGYFDYYNWLDENKIERFQHATKYGEFWYVCETRGRNEVAGANEVRQFYPEIRRPLSPPYDPCNPVATTEPTTKTVTEHEEELIFDDVKEETAASPTEKETKLRDDSVLMKEDVVRDPFRHHREPAVKDTGQNKLSETTTYPRVQSTTIPKSVNNAIYTDLNGASRHLWKLPLTLYACFVVLLHTLLQ